MATGGYIKDVSLSGRPFSATGDAELTIERGGDSNEVKPNGDNTGRLIKEILPWSVEGLVVEVDPAKEDYEYLNELRNRNGFWPVTLGMSNGAILQGDGQIIGNLNESSKSATASVNLKGTGTLTQQ